MVAAFLEALRERGIQVWAEAERLRCRGPVGSLTPELRRELEERKQEILEFLRWGEALEHQPRAVVPLQPAGNRPPIFGVPGHNGDVFCYRALAEHLGPDQPFFGLQPPGVDGQSPPLTRVEDLASYFADQVRAFRPQGPYIITGFCAGGAVAFELAQQLLARGGAIEFVGLFGSPHPTWYRAPSLFAWRLRKEGRWLRGALRALVSLSVGELRQYVDEKLRQRQTRREARRAEAQDPVLERRARVQRATIGAVRRYTARPFAGRIALFVPSPDWLPSASRVWQSLAQQSSEYFGPAGCENDTMLIDYTAQFAELFRRAALPSRDGMRTSWTPRFAKFDTMASVRSVEA